MERDKAAENSGSSATSSPPTTNSHQRNGRDCTDFLPRLPQTQRSGNNVRPQRSMNTRSDQRRENRASRSESDNGNIPNIRFRGVQPSSPTQASPSDESGSSGLPDNTFSLNDRAVAASSSRGSIRGMRAHGGGRHSSRNQAGAAAPKGRNGTSPRRSNGRGRHNSNSSSNRHRAYNDFSSANEEADNDVDLTHLNRASWSGENPNPTQNPLRNRSGFGGFRGLGTEEQPLELLNESDAQDAETSVSRDEEIARQLQQEEWERASTPAPSAAFRNPSRLHFLQAIHGAMGGDNPRSNAGRYRGSHSHRVPTLRGSRHGALPRAALQLPDLFDILPPELVEMILGGGQMLPDENDYEALLEMGEQIGAVSRGLSQRDIDRIPTRKHETSSSSASSAEGPPSCSICLCEFEEGDIKRVLSCEHELHKPCIDQWLKSNATCPVCRKDVREG